MEEPRQDAPAGSDEGGFYCSTSGTTFTEREALADHYKSDLHRYNLKRKVAGANQGAAAAWQLCTDYSAVMTCATGHETSRRVRLALLALNEQSYTVEAWLLCAAALPVL